MSVLLNTKKLYRQKAQRFEKGYSDLFLHAWVEQQLLSRLDDLSLSPQGVAQGFLFEKRGTLSLSPFYHRGCDVVVDPYGLPFASCVWEVFVESMQLYLMNEVPAYLKEVHRVLKKGGYYVAGFLGGDSAKALRHHLIQLEAELFGTATLRLVPTLRVEQIAPLLSWASFQNIVVECVTVKIDYTSFLRLVHDIRAAGENGILVGPSSPFQRSLWQKLKANWAKLMPLHVEIIFLKAQASC